MAERKPSMVPRVASTTFALTLDVEIRRCERGDLPGLEWHGLFTAHREIIRAAFAAQQRGDNIMLLACIGASPIGQIWIDLARKRGERTALLWALRVFPFLQGRGIGRRLISAAEDLAQEAGCARVEIGAEWNNPRASTLYQKLGYAAEGAIREVYSYRTPSGIRREVQVDEVLHVKTLPAARRESTRAAAQ
jgi:GNAT superfamily N-acetyltransferase